MKTHIVSNPKVLGGKPCIEGTRIPVYVVLEKHASLMPAKLFKTKMCIWHLSMLHEIIC